MCPACIGSALLVLSGIGSAGGAAAFTLRSITRGRSRSLSDNASGRAEQSGSSAVSKGNHEGDAEISMAKQFVA